MTWLSKQLLVKQQRKLQLENQQLFLIKQSQQENRAALKENFSEFTASLPGLVTFTASGAVYELMQSSASEQSDQKSESSISNIQRWFFMAEKLQLF